MAPGRISMRRKMTLALILMLLAFVAVISKLFVIQFVQAEELQEKAEDGRTRDMMVAASRGTIFDRNGNKLVISVTADSITASPPDVKKSGQAGEIAAFLARALDMDEQKVLSDITKNGMFSWVKRKVDFAAADSIRQEQLPGIHIIGEPRRYYPKGMLAANIIGYAGMDNIGLEGLEYTLDTVLRGQPGRIIGEYDAKDRSLPQGRFVYVPPTDGYDVYLTIDENIQYFCERELDKLMLSDSAPKSAGVIMMRPGTGEILAMAQRSSYDPNYFGAASPAEQRNVLVSDNYEPGSTFKIITAAAALEEGTASLQSRYFDRGYVMVYGTKISCSHSPHGSQSFTEAVQNSCNPALIEIGQSLEAKEKGLFYKYIRAFGFGAPSGVDLPGEATGIMQPDDTVGPVGLATICIGQGISVTPMQMISAVAAVANGGKLLKPQIVHQIKDGETIIKDFAPQQVRQVISAETAETLRGVLEAVVLYGTGRQAYIEGYRVGGKTGTAQKPGPGGYMDGKFVASFVGMAPVNDPQVVCLVFVDEPVVGHHQGSVAAAPVFRAVLEDTMRYLGVVPQIGAAPQIMEDAVPLGTLSDKAQVPDLRGLQAEAAREVLLLAGFRAEIGGAGAVVGAQDPAAFTLTEIGSTVTITLEGAALGQIVVPDLSGKRLSAAAEMLTALGLKLSAAGTGGPAYEQDPPPGTPLSAGATVKVKFGLLPEGE
jgi:stage V sporulation protein D (sporulation-specific penicillin-binding protein)